MAIGTFAELKTATANWLDRSDLTDRIPEFIALAEARFNRVLRIRIWRLYLLLSLRLPERENIPFRQDLCR